ncbi:MAG: MBL fold metallo-hydrolase [Bowdeniella nasicola]|nr:MBL fold metallo-hydrolase [Bowdeniella nasicola]
MIIRRVISPVLAANAYLLIPEDGSAIVVDPGAQTSAAIIRALAEYDAEVAAVLLTHGHPDHVWEAATVAGDAPVYIPAPDLYRLDDPARYIPFADFAELAGSEYRKPTHIEALPDTCFSDGGSLAGLDLRAIPSPGHSEGSTVFLCNVTIDDAAAALVPTSEVARGTALVMLSGDVIFAGAMGRTDLPGGNAEEMTASLRTLHTVIDPATVVLPGHGPGTTMAHELRTNPFLQFGAGQ